MVQCKFLILQKSHAIDILVLSLYSRIFDGVKYRGKFQPHDVEFYIREKYLKKTTKSKNKLHLTYSNMAVMQKSVVGGDNIRIEYLYELSSSKPKSLYIEPNRQKG